MLDFRLHRPGRTRASLGSLFRFVIPVAALLNFAACNRAPDTQCTDDCPVDLQAPTEDLRRSDVLDMAAVDLAPAGPAADIDFEGLPIYPTGSHYTGVEFELADFDSDGVLDAVMAIDNDNELALLIGDGAGGFLPARRVAAPGAMNVAVADLNKDGKADLLYSQTSMARNQIGVLLGKGDGTFAAPIVSGPTGPWAVPYFADFTGDGKIDLLTSSGSFLCLITGRGDGRFDDTLNCLSAGLSYDMWTVADVNGDSYADIITAKANSSTEQLEVRLGKGDGTFASGLRLSAINMNELTGLASTDCNGDGMADMIITDEKGISVRKGASGGALVTGGRFADGANADHPAVGDWNGDGKIDIIVGDSDIALFKVLLGKGDCNFDPPELFYGTHGQGYLRGAHLNKDNKLDLLISQGGIGVALGNSDGTVRAPRVQKASTAPLGVGVGDLDGDGKADLVTTHLDDKSLSISLGRGDGSFLPPRRIALTNKPAMIVVADLSGDGKLDVAVGLSDMAGFALLLGDGKGGLGAPQIVSSGSRIMLGDINGDGRLDIASFGGGFLRAHIADGMGNLTAGPTVTAPSYVWDSAVGDLDGDGRVDAAMLASGELKLYIAPSLGDRFAVPQVYPLSSSSDAVRIRDLDGDGKRDVLVLQDSAGLAFFANKGDGSLKAAQLVAFDGSDAFSNLLLLEDFNNDGLADLFGVRTNSSLQVNRTIGPAVPGMLPKFAARKNYWLSFPRNLMAADVTGDGRLDVLTAVSYASSGGYVVMLRNISH